MGHKGHIAGIKDITQLSLLSLISCSIILPSSDTKQEVFLALRISQRNQSSSFSWGPKQDENAPCERTRHVTSCLHWTSGRRRGNSGGSGWQPRGPLKRCSRSIKISRQFCVTATTLKAFPERAGSLTRFTPSWLWQEVKRRSAVTHHLTHRLLREEALSSCSIM